MANESESMNESESLGGERDQVTGGWAIGLLLNAWEVYFRSPITEAEVQREIERMR